MQRPICIRKPNLFELPGWPNCNHFSQHWFSVQFDDDQNHAIFLIFKNTGVQHKLCDDQQ